MSDAIRLRTMARKSVFNDGKYEGYSVQQVIDLKAFNYLRWRYYNSSMVSFLPDILDEIGISEEWRIVKPGTDPNKYNKLEEKKLKAYKGMLREISKTDPVKACAINNTIKARLRGRAYKKLVFVVKADNAHFSKAAMQRRNHGHY